MSPKIYVSLIGTVDLAGPCETAHVINKGPFIFSYPGRIHCSARRAETTQGSIAGSQGSALLLRKVNENLFLALAALAPELIKRYANMCGGREQKHTQTEL